MQFHLCQCKPPTAFWALGSTNWLWRTESFWWEKASLLLQLFTCYITSAICESFNSTNSWQQAKEDSTVPYAARRPLGLALPWSRLSHLAQVTREGGGLLPAVPLSRFSPRSVDLGEEMEEERGEEGTRLMAMDLTLVHLSRNGETSVGGTGSGATGGKIHGKEQHERSVPGSRDPISCFVLRSRLTCSHMMSVGYAGANDTDPGAKAKSKAFRWYTAL